MKHTRILFTALLLASLAALRAEESPASKTNANVTIVNYADTPVYATALSLPAKELYAALKLPPGTPLKATVASGQGVVLLPGRDNEQEVVRAYLSLGAGERVALQLQAATAVVAGINDCFGEFRCGKGQRGAWQWCGDIRVSRLAVELVLCGSDEG